MNVNQLFFNLKKYIIINSVKNCKNKSEILFDDALALMHSSWIELLDLIFHSLILIFHSIIHQSKNTPCISKSRLIDIRVLDVRGLDVRGWTLGVWTFGVEPRTSVFRRSGFGVRGSYQYLKMVKKTPNVRTPNVRTPNVRTPNVRTPNVRKHHRSKN